MTNTSSHTKKFERLMEELALGSEDAVWELAETYTPHILRAVRAALPAVIRPKLDSQDFAQAVWASLLLKRTYLSRVETPQQLIGLLAATARHKVLDAYRHYTSYQSRDVRREESLAAAVVKDGEESALERGLIVRDPTPSQVAMLRERWAAAVERRSPRDQEIIALRIKGLTYESISSSVGVSFNTVRRVISRTIEQLSG